MTSSASGRWTSDSRRSTAALSCSPSSASCTIDPTRHHHHHLICTQCGKVEEFDDDLLENLEHDIEQKTGFQVVDHQVKFFGICKECQAKQ